MDAVQRAVGLPDAARREVYHVDPTERLIRGRVRRADGFVRPRGARVEVRRQRAAAQGMGPEVEAAVQVASRFDGLNRRVLVYFKLAGAALLHQAEDATCARTTPSRGSFVDAVAAATSTSSS